MLRVWPLTNPSWLASVYSTCSRPSPTLDFYTQYNSSERVRRQCAGWRGTRRRFRKL